MGSDIRGHHPYGMSKFNYWEECPGFLNRSGGGGDAAEDGQLNHDRMEAILHRCFDLTDEPTSEVILHHALPALRRELDIPDEDLSLLHYCCREVGRFLDRGPSGYRMEERVEIRSETGSLWSYGYFDLLLEFFGGTKGVMIDYKFGRIPVPHAEDNAQGLGYALACLQRRPDLESVMVVFIQPKTGETSSKTYSRADIPEMLHRVEQIIGGAISVDKRWGSPDIAKDLSVTPYCKFCARDNCPKLASQALTVASHGADLPLPKGFHPDDIKTPEEAATVNYLVSVLEDAIEPLRRRARDIARENGGEISFQAPDGKEVKYSLCQRSVPRSLGHAGEVAQALGHVMDPMEVLGAAKLNVTELEKIGANSLQEFAKVNGEKITKKEARERLNSILSAAGLLNASEGTIEFLRMERKKASRKEKQKQLN